MSRMLPVANVVKNPSTFGRKRGHLISRVVKYLMRMRPGRILSWARHVSKTGKKATPGSRVHPQLAQAQNNIIGRQVSKNGLPNPKVGALIKAVEFELTGNNKSRTLLPIRIHAKLGAYTVNNQFNLLVDPEIMARLEVSDQVHSAAQGSAGHVDENIIRPQALLREEIELKTPDVIPKPTNGIPVAMIVDAVGIVIPYRHQSTSGLA